MKNDNSKLNAMITLSENTDLKPSPDDFWFSWPNQKIHTYNVAVKLLLDNDMDPEEAIELAQDFVNTFHRMVMRKD